MLIKFQTISHYDKNTAEGRSIRSRDPRALTRGFAFGHRMLTHPERVLVTLWPRLPPSGAVISARSAGTYVRVCLYTVQHTGLVLAHKCDKSSSMQVANERPSKLVGSRRQQGGPFGTTSNPNRLLTSSTVIAATHNHLRCLRKWRNR